MLSCPADGDICPYNMDYGIAVKHVDSKGGQFQKEGFPRVAGT